MIGCPASTFVLTTCGLCCHRPRLRVTRALSRGVAVVADVTFDLDEVERVRRMGCTSLEPKRRLPGLQLDLDRAGP